MKLWLALKVWLKKPHPFIFNEYSVFIPGAVTVLIILILRPFEFSDYGWAKLIPAALLFGSLASLSIWAGVSIIRWVRPNLEEDWTIWKEMILIVAVLILLTLIISVSFFMIGTSTKKLTLIAYVVSRTLAISIFPILISLLYEQYTHLRKNRMVAEELNSNLKQKSFTESIDGKIDRVTMTNEQDKVVLRLAHSQIVFLKSEGNYVEVYYLNQQVLQRELVRNRLKKLHEQIGYDPFFRCHKRYVINLDYLIKLDGHARNLTATLAHYPEMIAVSREQSKQLLTYLQSGQFLPQVSP